MPAPLPPRIYGTLANRKIWDKLSIKNRAIPENCARLALMSITEKIKKRQVLISDGAWGTQLQARGLLPGECPELWCLTRVADVLDIAQQYAAAGAELIKTNSFGGNRVKLQFYGLEAQASEINQAAAKIARDAAGANRFVLGSIGPSGKILMAEEIARDELFDAFTEQAMALEKGGADAALIESMLDLEEMQVALAAVRQTTRLETICTMTFTRTRQGEYRTIMGISPTEMAHACLAAGADIIGANCGQGFAQMLDVAREIRAAAPQAPILVHANAGLPERREGRDVFPDTPAMMAGFVPALIETGVNIIGGCCGTTAAHIAAIATAVKEYARQS